MRKVISVGRTGYPFVSVPPVMDRIVALASSDIRNSDKYNCQPERASASAETAKARMSSHCRFGFSVCLFLLIMLAQHELAVLIAVLFYGY
ncbi:MAG: hypothetical protein HY607_10775 [Planctomycetes bacterium]|uniref:hypothetical protein n=1 Tax=Candidatus Wunengus californicus TaxID=3367619 RepID=UPI0040293050|nr:hypothetical protein [Planctomycetota bacterium]MBI4223147.1 hypothetical protein [Planctomycetota bacterium]